MKPAWLYIQVFIVANGIFDNFVPDPLSSEGTARSAITADDGRRDVANFDGHVSFLCNGWFSNVGVPYPEHLRERDRLPQNAIPDTHEMRIAHFPSSYLPDHVGGTEHYVHRLCEGLGKMGHEIVVAHHKQGGSGNEVSPLYRIVDLEPLRQPTRLELYRSSMEESPPGFEQFLREFSPHLIHFHAMTLGCGIDHARAALKRKIPYVITYHVPSITCTRGTLVKFGREVCDTLMEPSQCGPCTLENQGLPLPLAQLLGRSSLKAERLPDAWWAVKVAMKDLVHQHHQTSREFHAKATHIVACSQWSKDSLVLNGVRADKISVYRQAMPGPTRKRRLRLPVKKSGAIRLGFLGRFVPDKGPDLLLEAIPHLRAKGLKIECELSGPMNPRYEPWARQLFAKHISEARYLGFIPDGELNNWLQSLHLLVVPSRWMELGTYTLLEAWDNGTPVIGADLGGIPEFIRTNRLPECLFRLNDPISLAEAVIRATMWDGPPPEVTVPGTDDLSEAMAAIYSDVVSGFGT
jgi:glycosyltransferase involved in cell wall biosynthesis